METFLLIILHLRWPACCYFQKINPGGYIAQCFSLLDLNHSFCLDRQDGACLRERVHRVSVLVQLVFTAAKGLGKAAASSPTGCEWGGKGSLGITPGWASLWVACLSFSLKNKRSTRSTCFYSNNKFKGDANSWQMWIQKRRKSLLLEEESW